MPEASSIDWLDELRIKAAIGELNAAFCHHLDHGEREALVELFTDDAFYTHGPRVSRGKEKIAQVFARRAARGVRTARHVQSGLRIAVESPERARGMSVCLTFAADAAPPIASAEPFLVADFEDRYRLCEDGRWRFAERHIHRIFEGAASDGPMGMPEASEVAAEDGGT